jgi:epoxyqueuosine reductase
VVTHYKSCTIKPSGKTNKPKTQRTTMKAMADFEALHREGCKTAVANICHLKDLQNEIEERLRNRQFDQEFAKEHIFRFKFAPPSELTDAQSIIIIAMPRLPTKAIFNWKQIRKAFILPPTYTAYDQKRLHVEALVADAVGKLGYHISPPNLPLRLLAARCGLTRYGRNNIAYVEGMGSFMRLTAVYSDMPPTGDVWVESQMMPQCQSCDLCQNACPTGAISSERFLLHAEKCITYHNEKRGNIPFPSWIDPAWHNCIVGCMKCQAACPQNKPYLSQVGETVEFTSDETRLLLQGASVKQIPPETWEKLRLLSLTDYLEELPRNLSVLLNKPNGT